MVSSCLERKRRASRRSSNGSSIETGDENAASLARSSKHGSLTHCEDTPKPNLSDDSLTPEQVAVYRAVLKDCTKKADGTLNLANKTHPLD